MSGLDGAHQLMAADHYISSNLWVTWSRRDDDVIVLSIRNSLFHSHKFASSLDPFFFSIIFFVQFLLERIVGQPLKVVPWTSDKVNLLQASFHVDHIRWLHIFWCCFQDVIEQEMIRWIAKREVESAKYKHNRYTNYRHRNFFRKYILNILNLPHRFKI